MLRSLRAFSQKVPLNRSTKTRCYDRCFANKLSDDLTTLDGKLEIPISEAIQWQMKQDNSVVFVEGSWWLGNERARNDFEIGPRIPNSHFFDIDDIADKATSLPHMMPSAKLFAAAMDNFGIQPNTHVIVYAIDNCPYLHRAWYQFASMGHDYQRVHLLAGTLADWQAAGGSVDTQFVTALRSENLDLTKPSKYPANEARNVMNLQQLLNIVKSRDENFVIVDARNADRFFGRVNEPRPGLKSGHMPGAKNINFMDVLDPKSLVQLKQRNELEDIFTKAGVDILSDNKIIATCGSGATACTLAAALVKCGRDPSTVAIYDGSWAEWGAATDVPIVTTEE